MDTDTDLIVLIPSGTIPDNKLIKLLKYLHNFSYLIFSSPSSIIVFILLFSRFMVSFICFYCAKRFVVLLLSFV